MTTIVYDHQSGKIACDSMLSNEGLIVSLNFQKWLEVGGVFWFFCGATCDFMKLIERFCENSRNKPDYHISASSIVVRQDGVFECAVDNDTGEPFSTPLNYNYAIGSGTPFALAALDFGRSARESVEYASTRDAYTGGDCHVFDCAAHGFSSG